MGEEVVEEVVDQPLRDIGQQPLRSEMTLNEYEKRESKKLWTKNVATSQSTSSLLAVPA